MTTQKQWTNPSIQNGRHNFTVRYRTILYFKGWLAMQECQLLTVILFAMTD